MDHILDQNQKYNVLINEVKEMKVITKSNNCFNKKIDELTIVVSDLNKEFESYRVDTTTVLNKEFELQKNGLQHLSNKIRIL